VGEDYFLVTSTFAYFPGIPVFHSKDLVHWKIISYVINRKEQADFNGLGVSKGVFAPTIRYNKGTFYVTCTLVDGGGNFVVTSKNAAGPWSKLKWLKDVEGIDPSLFFDEDNSWLVYNSIAPDNQPQYNGHRTIRMKAFDIEKQNTYGEELILVNGGTDLSKNPRWIEGPHIYKKEEWYYLIAAEGGTGFDHSVVAFRSSKVTGPYVPYEHNPVLKQEQHRKYPVTSTGHADLVDTPNGYWHAVFLGCRPYEGDHYNTGRETFLVPVTWKEGWPLLNAGHEKVEYSYPLPLPAYLDSGKLYSGNFKLHEAFGNSFPGSDWMFLRSPEEKWYHSGKGVFQMQVRPETCSGSGNPSFIGRRQQHLNCSASCKLEFYANDENEKAGLIIFQNEDHYYFICISREKDQPAIQLFQSVLIPRDGCRMKLLSSEILPGLKNVELRIDCMLNSYSFNYRINGDQWKLLKNDVDAKFLSTRVAGGFVGCVFGMYATSLGKPSSNMAKYFWFEYKGMDELC